MKRTKKPSLTAILLVLTLCLGFALTGCVNASEYPAFKNPVSAEKPGNPDDPVGGKYSISVVSAGGLPLNGVRITAKKDGNSVASGISKDGIIELSLAADEYTLVPEESSLPAGYFVPDGTTFKTSAESRNAKVILPSSVISTTASADTRYSLGDVMHDFGFTATDDNRHTLSGVLSSKKAVLVNFWYKACNPCQSEFPAIQKAYEAYADKVGIIALSAQDNAEEIKNFKEERGLSFHMANDAAGVTNLFSVKAFPTSVIIDRYGVVAHIESGSIPLESTWKAMFNKYTADDYIQQAPSGDDTPDKPADYTKPDPSLTQPESAQIEAAILGKGAAGKVSNFHPETNEKDKDRSFPFFIGEDDDGKYVYASNTKVPFSFAIMYCDIALKSGDVLSYEYSVDTESGNDVLFVQIDKDIVGQYSGNSEGWKKEYGVYVANRDETVSLSFLYLKDPEKDDGEDLACIRNIEITDIGDNTDTFDQLVAATNGLQSNGVNYGLKLLAPGEDGNDGIYYMVEYVNENNETVRSLLLTDILNYTYWGEKRSLDKKFTSPTGTLTDSSLYHLSYWTMSNYEKVSDKISLLFDYGAEHTANIIDAYYLQPYSDNELLPVNEKIKVALDAFAKEYCKQNEQPYYADQWLEMCFYYKHHGNKELGGVCQTTNDPVKGLSRNNAYELKISDDSVVVDIVKGIKHNGGGLWYKFVPATTSVYQFYSEYVTGDSTADPDVTIYDADGNSLLYNNNDESYDHFIKGANSYAKDNEHFNAYILLNEGETYYIQPSLADPQAFKGKFRMNIKALGVTSYEYLRICSTGYGTWHPNGSYNGINVALSPTDGYYHAVTETFDYGSKVYIDFLRPNFFDSNDNSLYDLIRGGRFNFRAFGDKDYTQELLAYYYKSVQGKNPNDELYGMLEADAGLVHILNRQIYYTYGDKPTANGWLMFACYYLHIGE